MAMRGEMLHAGLELTLLTLTPLFNASEHVPLAATLLKIHF